MENSPHELILLFLMHKVSHLLQAPTSELSEAARQNYLATISYRGLQWRASIAFILENMRMVPYIPTRGRTFKCHACRVFSLIIYLLTSHITPSSGYLDDVMVGAAMETPSVAVWAVAHSNLPGTLGRFPRRKCYWDPLTSAGFHRHHVLFCKSFPPR